jgi:CRP-like cAMP-binding protein
MSFGELAVLGHDVRTVEAVADGEVELAVLDAAAFHALHDDDPGLQAALLSNMLAGAYELVARATAEATARA